MLLQSILRSVQEALARALQTFQRTSQSHGLNRHRSRNLPSYTKQLPPAAAALPSPTALAPLRPPYTTMYTSSCSWQNAAMAVELKTQRAAICSVPSYSRYQPNVGLCTGKEFCTSILFRTFDSVAWITRAKGGLYPTREKN